jgi:hypothetical protein
MTNPAEEASTAEEVEGATTATATVNAIETKEDTARALETGAIADVRGLRSATETTTVVIVTTGRRGVVATAGVAIEAGAPVGETKGETRSETVVKGTIEMTG